MWAVTGSVFALAFAVLGPVIAVASITDGKLHGTRRAKREWRRFRDELETVGRLIDDHHARERAELADAVERLIGTSRDGIGDRELWRDEPGSPRLVSIGRSLGRSALRLDDAPPVPGDRLAAAELDAVRRHAGVLADVPLLVDPSLGIGVCGPAALAEAAARAILVQLAGLFSPLDLSLTAPPDGGWAWLRSLPHRVGFDGSEPGCVRWMSRVATAIVAIASEPGELPADCRVVLQVGAGSSARLLACPGIEGGRPVSPFFASAEFALERAVFLSAAAVARGAIPPGEASPADLGFSALPQGAAGGGAESLDCCFAWSGAEPLTVDLVAHGPHAIVGGTTGSGKSELLVSWILAMAASHSPAAVNFLLIDFKGGASFAAISGLAHVVGLVTDLDERVARRAILSLGAEIRFRESFLAKAGARAIAELPPRDRLARLVIVVDEFAAMVVERPELQGVFADLAARGRSLGIHLILCTQRPAGIVRDVVLANAQLRISLRVNNTADSTAVVGSAAAAELPSGHPGRAIVSLDGQNARQVRVALAMDDDVRRVAAVHAGGAVALRRPWCDDLPLVVRSCALPPVARGVPIGLLDLPAEQRQGAAVYDPATHGNLLVIGGHRSGKSNALRVLAATGAARVMPRSVDDAWDFLAREVAQPRGSPTTPALVLIDDLDAIVANLTDDHQQAFLDMLVDLLRSGPATGRTVAVAVRRIPSALHSVAELCDSRLVLRLPSRQDHVLAGGEPAGFEPAAPPGRGEWLGNRLQLALYDPDADPDPEPRAAPPSIVDWSDGSRRAVVSTAPAAFERALRESGCAATVIQLGVRAALDVLGATDPVVIVGNPESWQANWGLASTLRGSASLVFHGCTPAEFRAVSGQRRLPPPIVRRSTDCWLLEPDGSLSRVRAFDDADRP
ncbi:MAG TPA: hypothetical protein DCP11_06685 [Microbacteriaceae bacterium]|nr:hypothetical protein [Microbacteriaceae bacterium]